MFGFLAQQILGFLESQLKIERIFSWLEYLPIYEDVDSKLKILKI
jgi:hypothetical protein